MELKIHEMEMYRELAERKAAADEKVEQICAWTKIFVNTIALGVMIVTILLTLVTMALALLMPNVSVWQWATAAVFGSGILFCCAVVVRPIVQIRTVQDAFFKWCDKQFKANASIADLRIESSGQRDTLSPGSDESFSVGYHYEFRIAALKTLHRIVDSLVHSFKTKIPDGVRFHAMIEEEMHLHDELDVLVAGDPFAVFKH